MKRFLVFLFVVFGPVVGFGQTLRTTINGGILSQSNKGITATKLNNVLVTVADSVSGKVNKSGGVMSGSMTAPSFVRAGGTSSQFLKADGSVDASDFAIKGSNNVYTGTNAFGAVSAVSYSSTTGANFATTSGNVGVGTYSPSFKLDVNGTTRILGTTQLNGNVGIGAASSTQSLNVYSTTNDIAFQAINAKNTGSNYAVAGNATGVGGTLNMAAYFYADGAATNQGIRVFNIAAKANNYALFIDSPAKSYFQSSVLIGTLTDAGYKFDVNGIFRNTADAYFATTSGAVGVGTITPSQRLDVVGNIKSNLAFISGAFTTDARFKTSTIGGSYFNGTSWITPANGSNPIRLITTDQDGIGFYTQASSGIAELTTTPATMETYRRVTIADGGNCGIGILIPAQKLDVNGTAQATQFKLAALNIAPASATATGVVGEIRIDGSYIYVCTATNVWRRSAITSW